MSIQRIHVENFKSFSELDIELSRFNVVIGSNAAGKSNFISIFKYSCGILQNTELSMRSQCREGQNISRIQR